MTTYGEIVEPISRATWEDWDDVTSTNQLPTNNTKLEWISATVVPEDIDSFIILEGKYLYDCVKNETKHLNLIDKVKEVDINFYRVDESHEYVVVIKDYNILQSSEIVELLKPFIIASKNLITIQTKPLIEYQCLEFVNRNCLIRVINASKAVKLSHDYPKLEQPNFISGIAAGAICLREHLNLSGKAIICYMEHPEQYEVEEIQALLKDLKVISTNIKLKNILNSNLYI